MAGRGGEMGRAVMPTRAQRGLGFGTAPVFLAAINTILGAVLFLRFGYAVGNVGLLGSLAIILIGHTVTLPTALAIAEIATNRRVEGGGEYFIISRSFGTTIGASIGIALYLSQAISVAFYMIAFAEAFRPLAPWFESLAGVPFDVRMVSYPAVLALLVLMLTRGANLGVKALWVVAGVLAVSLALFFLGRPLDGAGAEGLSLLATVDGHDSFFLVFAIVFPAFTGMTAGVGLSGDLANPRRSIPLGTLAATVTGMLVYVAVVVKLAASATPEMLASEQLIMSNIALWGPIIPIGLACATVSSAIGSILVAPRTLQALAGDGVIPSRAGGSFLAAGSGPANEPRNATLVTGVIAFVVVVSGNVDFVARIISMFFMVTYGSLCAISFLEHFAARPSYRPTFRSRWYVSLLGAVVCLLLMFQMDPIFAALALVAMAVIYGVVRSTSGGGDDLAVIFRAAMTQATRHMQVRLQSAVSPTSTEQWRPAIIMVDGRTFDRSSPLQLLSWLCQRHAVGTYVHFMPGPLDREHYLAAQETLRQLIEHSRSRGSSVFVDTIVSPSMRSALAQALQVPGIAGMDNNTVMFEFSTHDPPEVAAEVCDECLLAAATDMDLLVLRHGDQFFGTRSQVDIWLTWHDYENAPLMILLCYILVGHPSWHRAEIRIFAAVPEAEAAEETARLEEMVATGRIPVSARNLVILPTDAEASFTELVQDHSARSDLVVLGFTTDRLRDKGAELLQRHPGLGDVLFVCGRRPLRIE
jgi:solute carrier family 12 sodium/potassium/chloride transporter 2